MNSEKLKDESKREEQRMLKEFVMIEIMFIICIQIQSEEFIILIKIMDLKINCFGESIFEYVKWDNK